MSQITRLHHITLVTADALQNVDFYTRVLGLRLVKKTVNFDDPTAYHLYYGDQVGTPGSAITFFEWKHAEKGRPGIGGTHHFALGVSDENALLKWKRRLTDLRIKVSGPYDRHYFKSIYFNDPDGTILEIATLGPGWTMDEPADRIGTTYVAPPPAMMLANRDEARIAATTWPEPVPGITPDMALTFGMHHITAISADIQRTAGFFEGVLGMRRVKMTSNFDDPNSAHWYWGVGEGQPGTLITYFERDPRDKRYHWVKMGAGQTHHFALAVRDEATQLHFQERMIQAGVGVSEQRDRIYFKSIYSRDPDGHIVEVATEGPGFAVDESVETLGERLMLPPWLEAKRDLIEALLTPIPTPQGA